MGRVYFVGIGGIGMSGLARILKKRGFLVSGSDVKESHLTKELKKEGIEVFIGHRKEQVPSDARIVYNTRITTTNEEMQGDHPKIHRMEMLKQIIADRPLYAVTGAHGKTSTSSLLAYVLAKEGIGYSVGGIINNFSLNAEDGEEGFVIESDESDGSFLKIPPTGAIITNIDFDHMEFWKEEELLIDAYRQFIELVKDKELLFFAKDEMEGLESVGYSFGFDSTCHIYAKDIECVDKGHRFTLIDQIRSEEHKGIFLGQLGVHQVKNALGVYGLARALHVPYNDIFDSFSTFKGVKRRAEWKKMRGKIDFYDDYGHHPKELESTFLAFKQHYPNRALVVIFEPHKFTRTKHHFKEFVRALSIPDQVFITETFASGEKYDVEGSSEKLAEAVRAPLIPFQELFSLVDSFEDKGQIVLGIGAGNINTVTDEAVCLC